MIIVGAGMAGLLAANMLRRHNPVVMERATNIPNNHSAVLRFRSSIVGDTLGIPFKKVSMIKAHVPWRNPIADALMYSYKNTGLRRSDRSIVSGLVSEVRYIAPPDLIQQMFHSADLEGNKLIYFNTEFNYKTTNGPPIISTIPMPHLMTMLKYDPGATVFNWTAGATIKARVKDCDAYVSLLVPSPAFDFSRLSITGDELFIEVHKEKFIDEHPILLQAADLLGIPTHHISDAKVKKQPFSKINPIDDDVRKRFMHWATVTHNIYSLGRYATWRPTLQLDDLVKDVRLISHWISQGHKYEVAKVS